MQLANCMLSSRERLEHYRLRDGRKMLQGLTRERVRGVPLRGSRAE